LSSGRRNSETFHELFGRRDFYRSGFFPMDIASVFAWFANESMRAADLAHEPRQREIWTRLAVMWGLAELTADTGKSARMRLSTSSAAMGLKPPRGRRPAERRDG
jgi:hypothetical protein